MSFVEFILEKWKKCLLNKSISQEEPPIKKTENPLFQNRTDSNLTPKKSNLSLSKPTFSNSSKLKKGPYLSNKDSPKRISRVYDRPTQSSLFRSNSSASPTKLPEPKKPISRYKSYSNIKEENNKPTNNNLKRVNSVGDPIRVTTREEFI